MEGIDLAGVVDSDFQGIQINFAPPRPAGFANFRRSGQDLLFPRGGARQPFPLGGAHIPDQNHHCCLQSHRQSNQPVLLWPGAIRSATARLITPIPDQADEEMSSKGSFSSDKEILENKYDHDDDGDTCTD